MRHRELDRARVHLLRPRGGATGEVDARLRPSADLDLLPREVDAAAERFADRLLAGESSRVVLRGIRLPVAVFALGRGEAALAEAGPLERAPYTLDLDQVDTDSHAFRVYSGRPRGHAACRRGRVPHVALERPRRPACAEVGDARRGRARRRALRGPGRSTSSTASTRVSDFCACWPPGPLERDVRNSTSATGSVTARAT